MTGNQELSGRDVCGSTEFKFPGRPFANCSGKEASAMGKVFAGKVLTGMTDLGYEFVISSELSFFQDHSTWFFVRPLPSPSLEEIINPKDPDAMEEERERQVVSVTLRAYDCLHVMCGDDDGVLPLVRGALEESWSKGVQVRESDFFLISSCSNLMLPIFQHQTEKTVQTRVGNVHHFKLRGTPWSNKGAEGAEGHVTLRAIIGKLGGAHWRLFTATNLKGFLATLFFVRDPSHSVTAKDLALLSPHDSDRVRLVGFEKEDREALRLAIMESTCQEKEPDEKIYPSGCGCELRLQGAPLDATGKASVASRRLMCRSMEALARRGWQCAGAVTVFLYDRSAVLFQRDAPAAAPRVGCVALSVNNELRLLDFPEEDRRALRAAVIRSYLPGIERERQVTEGAGREA